MKTFFLVGIVKHVLSYWYPELKSSSLENPATPLSAIFEEGEKTSAGIRVSEEKALAVGAVYACVKVISETMAQMDLEVVERIGKTTRANTSHENYWLLHAEPSPYYNRFEWVQSMMAYALLWGNGYSKIKRNRFATAKEFEILPAWEVTPKMSERGRLYYEWNSRKGTEIILAEDMIHLKNVSTNGIVGLSPIEVQRESLGTALAKIGHEGAFYSNGAKASGILMTPGTMGDKEVTTVKKSFNEANEGIKNRFKTIVLEEGVKYQQLTIPQNDAQFLESKKFDQTEIAGWYRVPPHMIGNLSEANYSNIDAMDRAFAKTCIVPWAIRLQQEIDRKIFFDGERGQFMSQFNLDDLIKGDIKTRFEVYNMGIQFGILRPSEPREAEGWPMEGTDDINQFFMNSTMNSVNAILNPPAPAAPNTPEPVTDKAA